ncbi:Macro domain-containing protein MM_0177 [Geodia barretti]|uniref:Macro domain-containing protein MM_0177 n=1 Tax=Geodia barretti TaxID=519541 RepID=A0AA35TQT0_GEOBA|nr:Macro domain-containing protein MM_0177 [Geodia barretti]
MPARYVIHTVGPVWHGGSSGEPELLASCYRTSLELAASLGDAEPVQTVAFPAISTGVFGYPKDAAARVAYQSIRSFLDGSDRPRQVILIFFSGDDAQGFLLARSRRRSPLGRERWDSRARSYRNGRACGSGATRGGRRLPCRCRRAAWARPIWRCRSWATAAPRAAWGSPTARRSSCCTGRSTWGSPTWTPLPATAARTSSFARCWQSGGTR